MNNSAEATAILSSISNVVSIEERLFNVVSKPSYYQDQNGLLQEVPNQFTILRQNESDNTETYLSSMGARFEPIQPKQMYESFKKSLQNNNVDLSQLKFNESFNGEKIRFRVPIKKMSFTNLKGMQDETILYLNAETGFDGKTAQKLFIETFRMVCSNGMRATVTEAKATFKNTANNIGKLQLLMEKSIPLLINSTEIEDLYKVLDKKQITEAMRQNFIKDVFEAYNKNKNKAVAENKEVSARQNNIFEAINEQIEIEIQDAGGSLFALLNGFTRYNQHIATPTKKYNRADYLNYGAGEALNNAAYEVAKQYAERY